MTKTHQTGFTLIELLVALSIATVIILMVGMIFTEGLKHTRTISAEARLTDATSQFINTLVYLIHPATNIEETATNELTITHSDSNTSVLQFVSDELLYDGTSLLPQEISVDTFDMSVINSTVQIHFEFSYNSGSAGSVKPMVGTTTVTLRN